MLAGKADPATLRFPLDASPKLDGIRCMAMSGQPMSRSMKVLPNLRIRELFLAWASLIEGFDGELIVGEPTDHDVYRNTVSQVMSDDKQPEFRFFVFDLWDLPGLPAAARQAELQRRMADAPEWVVLLGQQTIHNLSTLDAYEAMCLEHGYEGIMTRDPMGHYKQGRASTRSQELLKVKRYEDAEARITGVKERMHNANEAFTNELGRTARSSHQANKTGLNTLGALECVGLPGTQFEEIDFDIGGGPGLTDAERVRLWAMGPSLIGQLVKFKFFPVGVKERPRHPQYLGLRSELDMSQAA
ncbi:hypothetical protein [Roseococcus sp.]|uniref:ATP-dependent DNA ligase n=1 Tax=Roseococcus sp. TaxID=2109646 RepID=UPI003BABA536